jgi:hypothetical protein
MGRVLPRFAVTQRTLALPAALAVAALSTALAATPAMAQGVSAQSLGNPAANFPRTAAMDQACAAGNSAGCQAAVVAGIDAARSQEGVGSLQLPADYDSLTLPQQLLVLASLERTDRGLPGINGLSPDLDGLAQSGAVAEADPAGPDNATWGSNWAAGEPSALMADFDWMYNDGEGSPNLDCTAANTSGCWGHRENILADYGANPGLGVGVAQVRGTTSLTELFASIDGQPTASASSVTSPAPQAELSTPAGPATQGYWEAGANGAVYAFGTAPFDGSAGDLPLSQPVVGVAGSHQGSGYWEVARDGGIFSYGAARFFGSTGGMHLNRPIVGMAATSDGNGYWLVAGDGGIFSYGDASFLGSTGGQHLNKPVVGMATTPDGHGYWLVASDGGIFAYGDAGFYGSTGGQHLNQPVVGMAPTPDGHGYWLVARDGGIFSFGDAGFYGSAAADGAQGIVSMQAAPGGSGYFEFGADGSVFTFGQAVYEGGANRIGAGTAVVGAAVS